MENPVYELHVNPTYSVCVPQRSKKERIKSIHQLENEKNLKDNSNKGVMSAKATRRLTNAVNWLVASAKQKWIFERSSNKRYSFKVNFITLTLPTTEHNVSDNEFKSVLLHNFINSCRYKYGLANYVWKVETQENGNIHAHFTTDTFIHWKDVRKTWNDILEKKGIIDSYTEKHEKMTFEDYVKVYGKGDKTDLQRLRKSFIYGTERGWKDPNSTDVHSVFKVKDLAAYLAKYMSKKEEDRRQVSGRLWSCSYNLSENNKLVLEMHGNSDNDLVRDFMNPEVVWKPIQCESKTTGKIFNVGEIFFYKMSDWGRILSGRLLEAYNRHRFNIRHSIDTAKKELRIVDGVEMPDFISMQVYEPVKTVQTNLI